VSVYDITVTGTPFKVAVGGTEPKFEPAMVNCGGLCDSITATITGALSGSAINAWLPSMNTDSEHNRDLKPKWAT